MWDQVEGLTKIKKDSTYFFASINSRAQLNVASSRAETVDLFCQNPIAEKWVVPLILGVQEGACAYAA